MCRLSSRAIHVGVARGSRASSNPRPPGPRRPSRQSLDSFHQRLLSQGIGRQGKQAPRRCHGREIKSHARAVQIHRRLEHGFVLTFAPRRGDDGVLVAARRQAFLDRNHKGGMRADFQPYIHAEISQRTDRRRELHRLPDSASPMRGVALSAGMPSARHRAEKRNVFFLGREIGERCLQRLGSGLHQGVVERVIHTHEPRENALAAPARRRSPPATSEARKE